LVTPGVDSLNSGDSIQLTVVVKDSLGRVLTGRPVAWATTDSFTVSVSSAGLAHVVGAGVANVTATVEGRSGAASFTGLVHFTAVATGYEHTCAIAADSTAYCWGTNDHGQLGHGDLTATTYPVHVVGGLRFVSISASGNGVDAHTCAVATGGALYCWGNDQDGQLGDGDVSDKATPVVVSGGYSWTAVAAGPFFSCGIVMGGTAYCWGYDANGSLGDSAGSDAHTPRAVGGGLLFSSIVAGNASVCALTTVGKAYCWGPGSSGMLGDSSTALGPFKPTPVVGGLTFTQLGASVGYTACGVTSGGQAYCWGNGTAGQLGDSLLTGADFPVPVHGGLTFSSVSAGTEPVCGIVAGAGYCWGDFAIGATGDTSSDVPVSVSGALTFVSITAGFEHACGVATGAILYCWGGDGRFGQLGVGDTAKRQTPTRVLFQP
jgi:alpha-tubulin suppressor-like RCC1 family protein